MIIQCPACSARFRLDEAKIKGRGARVRCRRCGESIVVIKPETSEAPAQAPPVVSPPAATRGDSLDLRSIVKEAFEAPPTPPPSANAPSPWVVVPPPQDEGEASSFPRRDDEPSPSSAPERDDVEKAFEKFLSSGLNVSPRAEEKGEEARPKDLTVDFRPEEKLELPKEGPPSGTRPRSDFLQSGTDSLAFLKEEYERGEKRGTFDISISVTPEPPPPGLEDEPAARPGAWQSPPSERWPGARTAGVPEPPAQPGHAAVPAPPVAVPEAARAGKTLPRQRPAEAAQAGASFLRPSVVALILVFVALAGGGAFLGFTTTGQDLLRGLVPGMESLWLRGGKPGPQYDVRNLIGYYEPNAKAGSLFVIKGQVTNVGRTRKSGIRVHAALLDAKDQAIAERAGYAGNVLPAETLRMASREKIDEVLSNRLGEKLANMDIAPGKSVPFMVVFFDVPAGIDAYRLEAKDGE